MPYLASRSNESGKWRQNLWRHMLS